MPTKTTAKDTTAPAKAVPALKDNLLTATISQLQTALPGLKDSLGDKKFDKRIKKAAKLLVAGIRDEAPKKTVPAAKKKTTKKDNSKKTAPKKKAIAPVAPKQ